MFLLGNVVKLHGSSDPCDYIFFREQKKQKIYLPDLYLYCLLVRFIECSYYKVDLILFFISCRDL